MALLPRDIQLRLSQRGMTGVGALSSARSSPDPGGTRETTLNFLGATGPPLHNMGLCSRLGGGPNAWKHFGPELDPGMRAFHKAPGRRGILERGLRGGGPGRPPFWRTLISPTERQTCLSIIQQFHGGFFLPGGVKPGGVNHLTRESFGSLPGLSRSGGSKPLLSPKSFH